MSQVQGDGRAAETHRAGAGGAKGKASSKTREKRGDAQKKGLGRRQCPGKTGNSPSQQSDQAAAAVRVPQPLVTGAGGAVLPRHSIGPLWAGHWCLPAVLLALAPGTQ